MNIIEYESAVLGTLVVGDLNFQRVEGDNEGAGSEDILRLGGTSLALDLTNVPSAGGHRGLVSGIEVRVGLGQIQDLDPGIAISDVVPFALQLEAARHIGDSSATVVATIDA